MIDAAGTAPQADHGHVFLGADHEASERRTWAVIALCGAMMIAEIVGGLLFGSIALVADGLHMSTHAGALLLAALAYRYARNHANDRRFSFGTGKLGDLAGFTSAIILVMIALLIGYESALRLLRPVQIHFAEAIPIAFLGLAVNIGSAWILGRGSHHHHHHHHHRHGGGHTHDHGQAEALQEITVGGSSFRLEIFEDGVPPRFRLHSTGGAPLLVAEVAIETTRPDGTRQVFAMADRGSFLESMETIPEPHAFVAQVRRDGIACNPVAFDEEQDSGTATHRDNNMRAAIVHVAADAAVSVLVIVGLLLARSFGWLWMDPLAGIIGATVIASWSYVLIRATGAILLDMIPDQRLAADLRATVEAEGDRVKDLHLWRVGPGHVAAILSIETREARDAAFYRALFRRFRILSHVTVEVDPAP